ncbi:CRIB domain-containing protein, partial [Drosera capensis]
MKDSFEPCLVLSLFMGCASKSSVICAQNASNLEKAPETGRHSRSDSSFGTVKNSFDFLAVPKLSILCGFQKFFRTLKSLSRLLVYKDEKEIDDGEMEIGFPTDVKHLTHIGPNGIAMSIVGRSWENSSASLMQYELAMAAQAESISQPV